MNTKDELEPLSVLLFAFMFSCFIGGLMVCVHLDTFEDEGFFWALFGGFYHALFIGLIAFSAAYTFVQVVRYCNRELDSEIAVTIILFSCGLVIMILLTVFVRELFLDAQH